jgi:hypothetical protein
MTICAPCFAGTPKTPAAGPVKNETTPTLTVSLAIADPANKQEATSIDADAIFVVLLNILIFINTSHQKKI